MFCPECGQQQSSPGVRFCTQCGFQLAVVSALLAQAQLPATGQSPSPAPRRPLLKRGALLGATLMWIAALFAAVSVGGSRDDEVAVVMTLFWLILMLAINLFGPVARVAKRLFAEEDPAPAGRHVAPRVSVSLPPPEALAASLGPPRMPAGERFHAPSVVEQTTRSLGREQPE
jgi:hypothetical protein